MQLVKRMNLVSLKPPGHFLVLKAYSVAEMISRKGKKSPVMKLVSTPVTIRHATHISAMAVQ